MSKTDLLHRVVQIIDHQNAQVAWVCAVKDGAIVKIARLAQVWGRTGTVTVATTDWGPEGDTYPPVHHLARAGGYGYDKVTAALSGATIGGVPLGNHGGDNPTLGQVCQKNGWVIVGCGYWT